MDTIHIIAIIVVVIVAVISSGKDQSRALHFGHKGNILSSKLKL
jgi:hypothetical protein